MESNRFGAYQVKGSQDIKKTVYFYDLDLLNFTKVKTFNKVGQIPPLRLQHQKFWYKQKGLVKQI
jgi:hypothetical protein